MLVAYVANSTGTATLGASDSVNGTYATAVQFGSAGAGTTVGIFYFLNNASSAKPTVTFTESGGAGPLRVIIEEWSNIITSGALDQVQHNAATTNTTAFQTNATSATSQAVELCLAGGNTSTSSSVTPTGGYASGNGDGHILSMNLVTSSTGAQTGTATLGTTTTYTGVIATFIATSAGVSANLTSQTTSSSEGTSSFGVIYTL